MTTNNELLQAAKAVVEHSYRMHTDPESLSMRAEAVALMRRAAGGAS